jgi:RNA polymerase sigma factor (sigma-70 family)
MVSAACERPEHDRPNRMTTVPSITRRHDSPAPPLPPHARDDARDLEASLREPERFGVIFDRYFAEIHRYVARRLGSDAADDIVAEAFLTAFRKRRRFDARRGIVRAWLYGIATNHMSRYQRGAARASRAMARTATPSHDEGHADQVIDRVMAAEVSGELAAAVAGLFEGDREVLLLVALGELSHAEVAAALGIPYGTVGSRLNRARRKLRAVLDAAEPGGQGAEPAGRKAEPADVKEQDHG